MARDTVTDKLARNMLADYGLAIIWKLHEDAATLHQVGNATAAESFLKIADAAEREWLNGQPADSAI